MIHSQRGATFLIAASYSSIKYSGYKNQSIQENAAKVTHRGAVESSSNLPRMGLLSFDSGIFVSIDQSKLARSVVTDRVNDDLFGIVSWELSTFGAMRINFSTSIALYA